MKKPEPRPIGAIFSSCTSTRTTAGDAVRKSCSASEVAAGAVVGAVVAGAVVGAAGSACVTLGKQNRRLHESRNRTTPLDFRLIGPFCNTFLLFGRSGGVLQIRWGPL